MQERPTVVFVTPTTLQQFLQQFPITQTWHRLPDVCLGFANDVVLPLHSSLLTPSGSPISPRDYADIQLDSSLDILSLQSSQLVTHHDPAIAYTPRLCLLMTAQLLQMAR